MAFFDSNEFVKFSQLRYNKFVKVIIIKGFIMVFEILRPILHAAQLLFSTLFLIYCLLFLFSLVFLQPAAAEPACVSGGAGTAEDPIMLCGRKE